MEEVPILNMDQIEELCEMVKSIQQENRKDLDSILSESVDIQYTTIISTVNKTQISTTSRSRPGKASRKPSTTFATSRVVLS